MCGLNNSMVIQRKRDIVGPSSYDTRPFKSNGLDAMQFLGIVYIYAVFTLSMALSSDVGPVASKLYCSFLCGTASTVVVWMKNCLSMNLRTSSMRLLFLLVCIL